MSKTPITERREWSFLPYRKQRDAATGLVHDLPPVVVEDGNGVIASCGFGGPDHDNEAFAQLMSAAPDLLKVAMALVQTLDAKRAANASGEPGFEFNEQLWNVVLPAARYAINKATVKPEPVRAMRKPVSRTTRPAPTQGQCCERAGGPGQICDDCASSSAAYSAAMADSHVPVQNTEGQP